MNPSEPAGIPNPSDPKVAEAILFVADRPLSATDLSEVMEKPRAEIEGLMHDLAESYGSSDRGFVLRRVGEGYRLFSAPECAPWLERFGRHGRARPRLSGAALEVLAIIAYRQPVSRAEIADIRGVDSDGVVRMLLARELIVHLPAKGLAGASLLGVSDLFLERMGLGSVDELPPLVDFMPDSDAVEDMEARLGPGA